MTVFHEIALTHSIDQAPEFAVVRNEPCPECGRGRSVQIADVEVVVASDAPEPGPLLHVPGGQLVMEPRVWDALRAAGARATTRKASVRGDRRTWLQVIPLEQVSLTADSLRSPYESCATCGGRARPRFDGVWQVDAAGNSTTPVLATIVGAEQIVVLSDAGLEALRDIGVDVPTRPLVPPEPQEPDDPHGWGDLI